MGTRTNFYKNPSITYKKDFSLSSVLQNLKAYNIITGNAPPAEEQPPGGEENAFRKRRHKQRPPSDRSREIEDYDGPMSHQDYVNKRRKEVNSSYVYQELSADVLGTSSSCINLVEYESDKSTSSEHEEKQDFPNSGALNFYSMDTCKSLESEEVLPLSDEEVMEEKVCFGLLSTCHSSILAIRSGSKPGSDF